MRTTAILAGIIALASAAPAASPAPTKAPSGSNIVDRQDGNLILDWVDENLIPDWILEGNWGFDCDMVDDTVVCTVDQGTAQMHARSVHGEPLSYTFTRPGYTSKSHTSYQSSVYGTLKYSSTSSEYSPYTSTSSNHHTPTTTYGRRGDYRPPQYQPTSSNYNPSYGPPGHTPAPYGPPAHTSPYAGYTSTPTSEYHGKPHSAYAPPVEPTSPPTCNFVESECIDCNEHPYECNTCNFMFLCGEKKQYTFYGFRDTITMCEETGEECSWGEYDSEGDEYYVPEDEHEHEHPHGEKPEYPYGDEHESPYGGKPEQPYGNDGKPQHPQGDHPWGPEAQEYGQKPNNTEYPEAPHGPWGSNSNKRDNSTAPVNGTSV